MPTPPPIPPPLPPLEPPGPPEPGSAGVGTLFMISCFGALEFEGGFLILRSWVSGSGIASDTAFGGAFSRTGGVGTSDGFTIPAPPLKSSITPTVEKLPPVPPPRPVPNTMSLPGSRYRPKIAIRNIAAWTRSEVTNERPYLSFTTEWEEKTCCGACSIVDRLKVNHQFLKSCSRRYVRQKLRLICGSVP